MSPLDDSKPVASEPTWSPVRSGSGWAADKSVCLAACRASLLCFGEEAARDLELGSHIEIAIVFPEVGEEGDALRVAHEPSRFMIGRAGPFLERGDAEDDSEAAAMGAHRATLRRLGSRRRWHGAKISAGRG
jgi:hypothetical protein